MQVDGLQLSGSGGMGGKLLGFRREMLEMIVPMKFEPAGTDAEGGRSQESGLEPLGSGY